MTKQQAKEKIKKLISDYEDLKSNDALKDINEAFTKQRFIQPFFEALGWDFRTNDVWPEEKVSKDRVDYAFKIGDFIKFFVEAKKFSVDLEEVKWAEQAIDYAYNKSVTWAVLTDFEGLKIFNSEWNKKPYRAVKEFTYKNYLTRFEEIWLLSKESIENGELDKKAEEWGVKEKKVPVTEQLAQDLTEWRDGLRKEIDDWNKGKFSDDEIDEAVQRFLDRLIFIRYAEDKGLEPPTLEPILREFKKSGGDLIKKLNKVFRQFDDWYDSRLFEEHFSEEMEAYSGELEKIMEGLYRSKESGHPYDFSAISSDVLGAVYEQYLGYLQKKETKDNKSKRKEQGIYYTPSFIVDYIVQNTLGTILKEKVKSEIKNIKILDPACGSGSFLIKAYQKLIDYYQKDVNHKIDTKSKLGKIEKIIMEKKGVQELSVAQKLNILRENIYGVDLDPKAVEIAQLNLLLKAIAKRTKLPNLSHKIVCGNSLISGDEKTLKSHFGNQWKEKRPFNWDEEFDEVFQGDNEEYEGQAYHITWVTHNSRVSERMVQFGVERGEPVVLSGNDEVEITKYILQIVQEEEWRVLNYNICRDHVHMILMCDENKRDNIVRKLKGKSTQLYKQNHGLKEEFHLWAQKYSWTFIESDEQMANTMEYIKHNRKKHNLSRNKGLQPIVASMITPFADAFAPTSQQGGFDVVIGNPPYLKEMDNKEIFEPIKLSNYRKYYQGKMDFWYFFLHRAIDVCKDGGYIGFITNSYFLKSAGASKLIERIKSELVLIKAVDLGDIKVFGEVSGKHMIHIYQKRKAKKTDKTILISVSNDNFANFINEENKKEILYQKLITNNKINFEETERFDFENCISLGNIYDVSQGVVEATDKVSKKQVISNSDFKVGDGVFVLSKAEVENMHLNIEEKKLIKKYLNTNNVGRYFISFDNEYLIYSDKEAKQKITSGQYPNIKNHLDKMRKFITSSNKPYGLHRPRESKYFENPKLICKGMFLTPEFCYDEDKYYIGFSFSVIIQKDRNYSLKYLLAILNSSLGRYWFNSNGKKRGVGVDIGVAVFRQFPVHQANNEQQRVIESLVDQIMQLRKQFQLTRANTDNWHSLKTEIGKLERQIDQEIYKLYGLTDEEIKIIEDK